MDLGSRLALCIWWPAFELQLERARMPALVGRPLALADATAGARRRVEQVCPLAYGSGARLGMPVSQAVALCPSLVLLEQDPDFYDAARERCFESLHAWSPIVELSPERGRVFVGTDGLERLYGTCERQLAVVRRRLSALFPPGGIEDLRLGLAPGKFAAWVAASVSTRDGRTIIAPNRLAGFLARQPVGVLPVSPRMIQRLERLGVDRLSRLAEIPEQALVAQFGTDGRSALAWATGRRIDRVRPEPRERSIRAALEFPAPVGRIDLLHGALDRLLGRALERPARRGRSVRGIRLSAKLEEGGSWSIRAIVKEPTGRADRLAVFLRSRIALSPPQRAVEGLELEFFQFGPPSSQVDLFGPKRIAPRVSGALESSAGDLLPALEEASRVLRLRLEGCALYRVLELQPGSRIPERRHALLGLG